MIKQISRIHDSLTLCLSLDALNGPRFSIVLSIERDHLQVFKATLRHEDTNRPNFYHVSATLFYRGVLVYSSDDALRARDRPTSHAAALTVTLKDTLLLCY